MKKILLLAALGVVSTAQAGRLQGIVLSGAPAVTVVGGYQQAYLQYTMRVTNTRTNAGGSPVVLGLQRQIRFVPAGSENNFCFGVNCYPPTVTTSPANADVRLANGAFDDSGILDYTPNNTPGVAVIRYAVFERGTQDSTYLTVRFDASRPLAAVASRSTENILAQPFPNPAAANSIITLAYALPVGSPAGRLALVSLATGARLREVTLLSAADIQSGLRFGGVGAQAGIAAGGCVRQPGLVVDAADYRLGPNAETSVVVATEGLVAGLYSCLFLDARGQLLAARRLQVQ